MTYLDVVKHRFCEPVGKAACAFVPPGEWKNIRKEIKNYQYCLLVVIYFFMIGIPTEEELAVLKAVVRLPMDLFNLVMDAHVEFHVRTLEEMRLHRLRFESVHEQLLFIMFLKPWYKKLPSEEFCVRTFDGKWIDEKFARLARSTNFFAIYSKYRSYSHALVMDERVFTQDGRLVSAINVLHPQFVVRDPFCGSGTWTVRRNGDRYNDSIWRF
jgi:hypothetical protein